MSTRYMYALNEYSTESEAQDAATALSVRMQNNPTDWIKVKFITGSNETGWQINPTLLADSEILTPDTNKTYLCFSPYTGKNEMPVTASELLTKITEYRTPYGQSLAANSIFKIVESDESGEVIEQSEITIINPTTDMSGYV